MDESDDEKLLNDDVNVDQDGDDEAQSESENDDDLVEERNQRLLAKLKAHKLKAGVQEGEDNESSDDAS